MKEVVVLDLRPLDAASCTGVGVYTHGLAVSLAYSVRDLDKELVVFSSGIHKHPAVQSCIQEIQTVHPHVRVCHVRVPNKLLHATLALFHVPHLDRVVKYVMGVQPAWWVSPNNAFTVLSPAVCHVQVVHDIAFDMFPHLFSFKQRLWHKLVRVRTMVQQAQYVLVPSASTARDVQREYGVKQEKVMVFPPVCSEEFFRVVTEEEKIKACSTYALPEKYIIHVGTHEQRKNIDGILDAYIQSGLHTIGVHLIFVGAGSKKIVSTMRDLSIKPFVHALNYVPQQDIPVLYALAECTVYASWYEGYGLPVPESLSQGTPVIVFNRGALHDFVGVSGVYTVHASRHDMLISTLREVLRAPKQLVQYTHKNPTYDWRAVFVNSV